MGLRRRSRAIPAVDARELRRAWVRSTAVRASLVAVICALVGAAFVSARDLESRANELVPGGRSGVVVIDLSLSIVNRDYAQVGALLERLIRAGNPTGLVVFSDVSYELLPPRTPARELKPLLRFFAPEGGKLPANPWTPNFQAGTRISEALELAYTMLRRDRASPASILLISDLETAPTDYAILGRTLHKLAESDVTIRVAALSPSSDALTFFGGILGRDAFVDVVAPRTGEAAPLDVSLRGETPHVLLLASAFALLLLAAHEVFAGRLALPAGAGWRRS